ncbi:MAG: PAS domain S-box protein [Planctomycetota bacterium]|jgi:PAS domain S-box-containing protein
MQFLGRYLHPQWFTLLVLACATAGFVVLWQGLLAQERRQIDEKVALGAQAIEVAVSRDLSTRVAALESYGEANAARAEGNEVHVRLSEANLFLALFRAYQTVAWLDPMLEVRWLASRTGEGVSGERIVAFGQGQEPILGAARDRREVLAVPARNRDDGSLQLAIFVPVHNGETFQGYMFGLLDFGDFLAVAITKQRFPDFSAAVFEGDTEIFTFGDAGDKAREKWRQSADIPLHALSWRLDVWPTRALIDETRTVLPLAALIAGALLIALIGLANYLQIQMSRERRQAARALAEREQRLRGVIDNVADAILTVREHGAIESFNAAAESIFGYRADEVWGQPMSLLIPESLATSGTLQGAVAAGARETVGRHKSGAEFPIDLLVSEMRVGEERLFIGIARDISERKEAEARLQQAQKMEAVGQLTGGVAHDFNNLLTVILGNLSLLEQRVDDDVRAGNLVGTASRAALRGADLTKRLLAFSRRQILEPKVLDLNQLVVEMDPLLRRSLGAVVEIKTAFTDGLWPAKIDPGQLESALLNLVINARDAMPEGGTVTIETANATLDEAYAHRHGDVAVGGYVLLAVSDTGVGIPEEVQRRIFEPFFTTKESSKGTGLGLSMVYGFVKQSGGHADFYSEVGRGTTIKLYFPKTEAGVPAAERREEGESPVGEETILVVEDDADVRATGVTFLKQLGYRVLEAEDGPTALEVLERADGIDLLFTDVVMPGGMNGPAVAAAALDLRPGLKVLYTSGYTRDAAFQGETVDEATELLTKPYLKRDLAARVRSILDR